MKREFIDYNQALKLKALGFDEPCFGFYQIEYSETKPTMVDDNEQYRLTGYRTCKNSEIPEHYISAPTFSQAFRWFREKYHIIGYPIFKGGKTTQTAWYDYVIYSEIEWEVDNPNQQWKTYEEAESACLNKLIEIVETKQP